MEIIEYKIKKGDTLESIAKEFNISVEELVDFHNKNCGITQQILGINLPIGIRNILIENLVVKTPLDLFKENILNKSSNKKSRYRTKQINIVKINDVISAHSTVECEYLFHITTNSNGKKAEVDLEDSVYNFYTNGSEYLADFLRSSDAVKRKLIYNINENGKILNLENLNSINKNWEKFKSQLGENPFFKNSDPNVLNQIINAGNIEYNSEEILIKNSNSNLFNQVVFSQYLTKYFTDFEVEEFTTQSHFFPQIAFTVECKTELIGEDENNFKFAKVGKPKFVDIDQIIVLYEKLYKPQIGFRFTDYLYDFVIDFTVSKEDGLITQASVNLNERIKNNMQSQVIYELKKVEL
ncbi:LysM peptidoglycan-binding domain-containing protein [Chryseobacterium sp.]|uniref:LysM peptidoglycan-binding domain-containing protein n=1 Tax=Chryseobacterium sp. TaxID=1871047 RepID=UPI003890DE6A